MFLNSIKKTMIKPPNSKVEQPFSFPTDPFDKAYFQSHWNSVEIETKSLWLRWYTINILELENTRPPAL